MSEPTLWELVVDGVQDATDRPRDEVEDKLRELSSDEFVNILSLIGWSVPAYSSAVRCHIIERED